MKEIFAIVLIATLLVGIAQSQSIWDIIRIPFLPPKPQPEKPIPLPNITKPTPQPITPYGRCSAPRIAKPGDIVSISCYFNFRGGIEQIEIAKAKLVCSSPISYNSIVDIKLPSDFVEFKVSIPNVTKPSESICTITTIIAYYDGKIDINETERFKILINPSLPVSPPSVPLPPIFKPVADFFSRIGILFRLSLGI